MRHHRTLLAVLAAGCSLAAAPRAQTLRLVPQQYTTIAAAIAAAANGDTIRVAPGVYFETGLDLAGKRLVLDAIGGPEATVIDGLGTGTTPILTVASGEPAGTTVRGFTFRGGAFRHGGAIRIAHTVLATAPTLRIEDCVFENNEGVIGCGIGIFDGGHVTVSRCTFRGNGDAGNAGAALAVSGRLVGAIGSRAQVLVESCRILDNTSPSGWPGAFVSGDADVTFESCLFARNDGPDALAGNALAIDGRVFEPIVRVVGSTLTSFALPPIAVQNRAVLILHDTIVWPILGSNAMAVVATGVFGPTTIEARYCDLRGGLPAPTTDLSVVGVANLGVTPQFADPTALSGDGDAYRLTRGSPLLDAGDPAMLPGELDALYGNRLTDGDRDGVARRDIGAHEYSPVTLRVSDTTPDPGNAFVLDTVSEPSVDVLVGVLIVGTTTDPMPAPVGQSLVGNILAQWPVGADPVVSVPYPGGLAGAPLVCQLLAVTRDNSDASVLLQFTNPVFVRLQ